MQQNHQERNPKVSFRKQQVSSDNLRKCMEWKTFFWLNLHQSYTCSIFVVLIQTFHQANFSSWPFPFQCLKTWEYHHVWIISRLSFKKASTIGMEIEIAQRDCLIIKLQLNKEPSTCRVYFSLQLILGNNGESCTLSNAHVKELLSKITYF